VTIRASENSTVSLQLYINPNREPIVNLSAFVAAYVLYKKKKACINLKMRNTCVSPRMQKKRNVEICITAEQAVERLVAVPRVH